MHLITRFGNGAAALTLVILLATVPMAQAGGNLGDQLSAGHHRTSDFQILPPDSNHYGFSYSEWSAKWWQWAISIPTTAHPLFDNADCNTAQSGPVWFLGGSFVSSTATRACTVPLGKAVFLPILNAECSTAEPPPFHGDTEAELRACAQGFMDGTTDLFATIDGTVIQNVGIAGPYRMQSPLYSFSAPADNVFFVPGPVTGQSVSDGVWLMLAPLSEGSHTIHFGGVFTTFSLTIDQTYNLTVVPGQVPVERTTWGLVKEIYRR